MDSSIQKDKREGLRLAVCFVGCLILITFCISVIATVVYLILGYLGYADGGNLINDTALWLKRTLIVVIVESVIFWTGIIMVYISSVQLGIRYRIWGIVLGWVPIANVIMLSKIIAVTAKEIKTEGAKRRLNKKRKDEKICATKYPILLVHGVFFRDFKHLNYWGRIPGELEKNGARIYYGNHNSASAVEDSAKELEARILEIIDETKCEKVNVIAHSKGGLDTRCAISNTSAGRYIASLTTINTPHRGCEFADYLLNVIPDKVKDKIAATYNVAATALGDKNPDFLAAVYDLTHEKCMARNIEVTDDPNIYYQSVGTKLNHASSGRFPLNYSYHLVKYFDGDNDGLVGAKSFEWGENYNYITVKGKRGVSHGDVIDLNRENFEEFDVREFYVKLVSDLRQKGF